MYINSETGNQVSVVDMQNYADQEGLGIEEYASLMGFTLKSETNTIEKDATSADLLDLTTFQTDAAAGADVVSQLMTAPTDAPMGTILDQNDTELAPVDTSLDSPDPDPTKILPPGVESINTDEENYNERLARLNAINDKKNKLKDQLIEFAKLEIPDEKQASDYVKKNLEDFDKQNQTEKELIFSNKEFKLQQDALEQLRKDTGSNKAAGRGFGGSDDVVDYFKYVGRAFGVIDLRTEEASEVIKINKEVENAIATSLPKKDLQKLAMGVYTLQEKENLINEYKLPIIQNKTEELGNEMIDLKNNAENTFGKIQNRQIEINKELSIIKNRKPNKNYTQEEVNIYNKLSSEFKQLEDSKPGITKKFEDNFKAINIRKEILEGDYNVNLSKNVIYNNFELTNEVEKYREQFAGDGFWNFIGDSVIGEGLGGLYSTIKKGTIGGTTFLATAYFDAFTDPESYNRIDGFRDLITNFTDYSLLPASEDEKFSITKEEGGLKEDVSARSLLKLGIQMVPFTGYLMMEAKKGNMSGVKQGVGRYLQGLKGSAKILTPLGKSLKNEVILADAAFRATILDNAKEAKNKGLDGVAADTYATTISLTEGVVQSIMPDVNFLKGTQGKAIKDAFIGNLKNVANKKGASTAAKEFFTNIGKEFVEEEITYGLNLMTDASFGLALPKGSEFLNAQIELAAGTIMLSGGMGSVGGVKTFSNQKKLIYNQISKNIISTDAYLQKMQETVTDPDTKLEIEKARKFARSIHSAVEKSPENVTADQIDLLVEKSKLIEEKKKTDSAFHPAIDEKIKNINEKISNSAIEKSAEQNFEKDIKLLEKSMQSAGLKSDETIVFEGETIEESQAKQKDYLINVVGKTEKFAEENKDSNGMFVTTKDGKEVFLVNKNTALGSGIVTTGQHEFLHKVLKSALQSNPELIEKAAKSLTEEISKMVGGKEALLGTDWFRRWNSYTALVESGDYTENDFYEEALPLFSEALSNKELNYDPDFLTKIKDIFRQLFQNVGLKGLDFESGEGVKNFIIDYNKAYSKGKFKGTVKSFGKTGSVESARKAKKLDIKVDPKIKTNDKLSKSVTDLQTELDNLDQSDFDFDLDQFENAKDNLKFKINAAKKKELAKPKTTEFDTSEKSTIGKINALIPKEIKTNEELRSNERVGLAIKKALAPNGIISNMMIGRRKLSTDELEIALESIGSRWMNYDPAAKRKTDSNVPITFGEWVMSNANFGALDAKRKVAVAEADKKNKTDLDNKEAQRRTNEESSESTLDTRKTYKPLTSNPKLIPGFVVTEIKNKLTNVISKLTSKLSTRPKGANAQTTPLIEEIKKAIGKVVGDATALPKQIINRMGNPKDGSYQKFLIDNKKSILENMTTTYLMKAIPAAVEKSVGGAYVLDENGKRKKDSNDNDIFKPKFVSYPGWVGKEIDREKVSTNKKGSTSGNQIVRRAIQVEVDGKFENSITDEDFVANFVGSNGKVIPGKRESLGKALAEEAGFEVLTKELQDENSEISKAFESNQKALGEVLADNFVQQVARDTERGTVKFSAGKAFRTTIKEIDASIDNIINYLNKENIYNVGGFGMLNELSLKNDDLFKLMKKNRELWQAYVLQGNKSKLTPTQQKKFLNIKNKSGVEYQKWINNSLNYYFNAIDATFGLEPGVAILQNPTAKAAALDTMRKLLKNIISTNKINPIEEFLNITKGWTVSGKSTSIFGNNTGLYNWITSIESVEIQNAVSESGLNLRSSKGSETNKTLYLNNKKALNTIKQETLAKDFISIYKGENKVELTDRDNQSNIAKKDLKTIFDFLQKQYTGKTILPEGVALILKTMNSSMRSPLKTAAKIEGAYLVEGLEAGDYTFEHGIPVTVISTMAAKYITDPKFKWDNIKNAIDKSKVYIIPKKIAKIIDTFYKATFSIDNALDTENPAIYRYQEVNKGLKDALKAAGVVNFDFNNFTYFRDPKKSVKRNIKFSKGVELNLVETGQQAINNARSLAYNNNVKRLDVKAEDISELTTNKAKADWLINKIAEGYNDFYFIDNKMNEVKAVKNVLNTFDVKGKVQQAKVKFSKSMNTTFNEMLQRSTGIEAGETIERSIARRRGATKGKFKVWMPSSLDDFKGLTSYIFAGKGRQGEADQKFFQDALITPYFRGVRAIEQSRQAFKDDFEALNKQMRPVLKKLGKIVPGTEFTHDQAIRVALWNASGYDIPGISESDIKTLVDFVNDNADLSEYTRKLQLISKRKEWSKPGDFWDAETILSDLNNLTEKVGRKEYLTEFIENVDIIFSEDNLNKVEAGYGEAQKDALKDIIYRMKNGTNRPSGSNKNENRFNNWVNNSIGAIMFFNRRSALLQTLSIANFINWGDNNVLKAGAAFANQPQYWKDFATLFNSSKLKQRRSGLKSDVNEAEIANAVKGSRNKAVSALSYLLKIGFTPTQLADSFAIASGGATFYRNRANSYLKEVNAEGEKVYTQKQAEEKAFEDFSQISEETQQSGDPALISSDQASTLGRLLLAFQNAPIQLNRSIKKAALDIKNRRRTPGQTMLQSDFSNISKIIYYGTVQNVIFSALQNALFALIPGFEDEDDELTEEEQLEKYGKIYSTKQSRIVNGMVDTTLKGGFGVPGAFISTIKNVYLEWEKQKEKGFIGDQGYTILAAANLSPPVGSKLRKIYSAIKTEEFDKDVIAKRGWDITIDGKFNLSPKYKVLGSVTEGLTNLPLDRMVAEVSSITEALDARNSKWQRIALALGWKTWDVNVKNEEHELIKIEAKQERKDAKAKEKQDYKDYRRKVFSKLNNKENNAYSRTKGAKLKKEYILKIGKEKGIK